MLEAIETWDFRILDWIREALRTSFLDWLMPKITLFGEMGIFWILVAAVCLLIPRCRRCGITLSAGLFGSLLICNLLLKNLVARPRPFWIREGMELLVKAPADYSFPSGHTMVSVIAAVILFRYDKRAGIPALILAAAVAFSRLYLYVHFPSDVLAGAILGILTAFAVIAVTDRIFRKRGEKKKV